MAHDNKLEASVEAAIHDAVQTMVRHVLDTYGIRLDDVTIRWTDTSTMARASYEIMSVQLTTTTTPALRAQATE